MTTAKLPIIDYIDGKPEGDYVAQIEIGSGKCPAYVILDTGSSTLAVWDDKFGDAEIQPTQEVQFVGYGTGHWAGPVVQTDVGIGSGEHYVSLKSATIAQIQSGMFRGQKQFYPSDGILGLAYVSLNSAANVGTTDFPINNYDSQQKWQAVVTQYGQQPVQPFFSELVKAGMTPNKFAFTTRRSIPNQSDDPANDPLNKGWFVLGGGEEHTELYTGEFKAVKEIDDQRGLGRYYNSNLTAIRVGDGKETPIGPPQSPYVLSNSIIDSGTNSLALTREVYGVVVQGLDNTGIKQKPETAADLAAWPSIYFTFEGENGASVELEVKPDTYWQLNCMPSGQSQLNISPTGMPQSILGLPLMNNYYVIFDRSGSDGTSGGLIKFAAPNPSGFPT